MLCPLQTHVHSQELGQEEQEEGDIDLDKVGSNVMAALNELKRARTEVAELKGQLAEANERAKTRAKTNVDEAGASAELVELRAKYEQLKEEYEKLKGDNRELTGQVQMAMRFLPAMQSQPESSSQRSKK
jgi:chromosome segregation ATPase